LIKKNFTVRLLAKFAVKWILKIPVHFAYILPSETLMSAKQSINDKLQDSVRFGEVLNNPTKKGLLLSLRVIFFEIGEYLAMLQARA